MPRELFGCLLVKAFAQVEDEIDARPPVEEPRAVGRPDGEGGVGWTVEGELPQVGAVGVHRPNLVGATTVGGEGDLFAVGRPARIAVEELVVGQVAPVGAVTIDEGDV